MFPANPVRDLSILAAPRTQSQRRGAVSFRIDFPHCLSVLFQGGSNQKVSIAFWLGSEAFLLLPWIE